MLLNWELRFDIILGFARGLLYLHHDLRLRIIHRDLKASNVLLNEKMDPKISDFGLARFLGGKQTEASITRRTVLTHNGYMSPAYALDGFFSIKSDVFSFGIMALEIIIGKKHWILPIRSSIEPSRICKCAKFAFSTFKFAPFAEKLQRSCGGHFDRAWKMWKENKALDLMDVSLSETCNANEFLRCVNVGLLCVQEDPSDRPTMSNVVLMIGSETASLPSPKQPAFVARRSLSSSGSSSKPLSVNGLTSTLEQGR
ncbi:Mitogen-activated protein kinase kinase kinase [Parasponia andersonii]|uniref:Mitogen-activated protein kinase kinase kinase n=1 Tax=Parasponia andersonii TaxID=3476 RepID=A0A2P5E4L6_PARAD|nr:Mitogen-activated protein kinase kinase kinase [Parasponia andersonii]